MKKLILFLFLVLSSFIFGQSTVVTFQVTDTPDNQAWNNGTWTVQLQPLTGNITNTNFIIVGTTTPVPNIIQSGLLNGSGGGSVTLTPNSAINPIGSQWNFTVCPQASTSCFSQTIFIFGTTQTITIAPPSIRINALKMILAYADPEVNTGVGQIYYNLNTGNLRVCTQVICNGSGFSTIAGSGGNGCIANPFDGGCALLGNPSIDQFIGTSVGAGTGWLLQLLATVFNSKVPININDGTGKAGVWMIGCGTDPGVGSGIAFTGPPSCTPFTVFMPSNAGSGFWKGSNTANKITMTFQNGVDAANDLFGTTPVANGGTSNTTPSGALVALFPTFTRNGDLCCFWNGSAWVALPGCTSAGGTVNFITENSGGSWACTTSPLGTPVGGTGLNTKTVCRLYAGNGTGAEAITSICDDNIHTTFLQGVVGDGAGFKHKRVTGCTTGATSGNTCTTTITWTTPFVDTNYTPVCTLLGPATLGHLAAISTDIIAAASVKVETVTDTNAAISGTINCIAVHD